MAKNIPKNLKSNPMAKPMAAILEREGKTDGMGYEVFHVSPGRGFSCNEYAKKTFPNGHQVNRRTYFPGPFDGMAGLSTEIEEHYTVWVGWDECPNGERTSFPSPPIPLPDGAIEWHENSSGAQNWYAYFGQNGEAAEKFAAGLSNIEDESPPFQRESLSERKTSRLSP